MNYEDLKGELLELRKEVKRIDDYMVYLEGTKCAKGEFQTLKYDINNEIRDLKTQNYILVDKVEWLMKHMNDVLKEIFPERSI